MSVYKFVWDDFCSWYLESVKPGYGEAIHPEVMQKTIKFFEDICGMLHPFMPFISEEIWHLLGERENGATIGLSAWPAVQKADEKIIAGFDQAVAVVSGVRNIRASKNIPRKEELAIQITDQASVPGEFKALISKLANLSTIDEVSEVSGAGFSFFAGKYEIFVPASESLDIEAEMSKLRSDLEYQQGFLKSVEKKLANERFVNNAPDAVVAAERKKQDDALAKIKSLEDRLNTLQS